VWSKHRLSSSSPSGIVFRSPLLYIYVLGLNWTNSFIVTRKLPWSVQLGHNWSNAEIDGLAAQCPWACTFQLRPCAPGHYDLALFSQLPALFWFVTMDCFCTHARAKWACGNNARNMVCTRFWALQLSSVTFPTSIFPPALPQSAFVKRWATHT